MARPSQCDSEVGDEVHAQDVADIFASMLEIDIIALRQMLTSSSYQLFLPHPITQKPVAIDIEDIELREQRCRLASDLMLTRSITSCSSEHCSSVPQCRDYAEIATTRCYCPHTSRNCLISFASVAVILLLLVLLTVLVSLILPSVGILPEPCDNCSNRCILLIGGEDMPQINVEYYHPSDDVECNLNAVGRIADSWLTETAATSGCYLSDIRSVAIRERWRPNKPPVLYRLADGTAIELPLPYPMRYNTGSTTVAVSASRCVSCGGYWDPDGLEERRLRECYQFDSSLLRWTQIAPLPRHLDSAAAVALQGTAYVVGGHNNGSELNEIYRYTNNSWELVTRMSSGRFWHSATALSPTELLVCGGVWVRADCQVYDVEADRWRTVGNLNTGRHSFAMVDFEGDIFAIGGERYDGRLKSVERFNRQTERWEMVNKTLTSSRFAFIAAVV